MGGVFGQAYLHRHHALIDGLVLSGTSAAHLPRDAGRGPPSTAFPNPRTDYDWLSRDEAEVDAYIADPLCGIRFTPDSARSFFGMGKDLQDAAALKAIRRDLPVYIFVGDADPVHAGLTRISPLVDRYREAGLTDVTLKVYPGGRHEMLNETNRDEVVADLLAWLEHAVAARSAAA
jgi:alpha-beta hydrolase superfamily lysophospholipase